MLKLVRSVSEVNVSALMSVYSRELGDFRLEQRFYSDLMEFFHAENAFYALWEESGTYCAALRVEPFADGLLVAGLETHPAMRNKGYATKLLGNIVAMTKEKLYSHVARSNAASLKVHMRCGFSVIKDYARYLDGSVSHSAVTLCIEKNADT